MTVHDAAKAALKHIVGATLGEKIIVFCDDSQREIGDVFTKAAIEYGLWTRLVTLPTTSETRREVDPVLQELLVLQQPHLCLNIFRQNDAETSFRGSFVRLERSKGARIGHCPGIIMEMITDGALSLLDKDYEQMFSFGESLRWRLKEADKIHVADPLGSDFTVSVQNRQFSVEKMNVPCGEVMCMNPVGNSFQGKLVCISGGGDRIYRNTPVTILSDRGLAGEVQCKNRDIRDKVKFELDRDEGARYLGEFAFGINPKARLVDQFLEAEKVLGTIHIAFGGSEYPTKTHLDLLVENPTIDIITADSRSLTIMTKGRFT